MTDAQIFQWLGITFFAMGIGMLTNPKFIKDIVKEFLGSTTLVFFGGLACVAIGFPLITFHNVWTPGSSLIITVIGWVALIKGLALLMFPRQTTDMYKGVLEKENKTYIGYGVIILGIILLYLGLFA
jgi:uncharacterized protein YjeT (DUF2065 family)